MTIESIWRPHMLTIYLHRLRANGGEVEVVHREHEGVEGGAERLLRLCRARVAEVERGGGGRGESADLGEVRPPEEQAPHLWRRSLPK